MNIVIGSTNPTKIKACETVFPEYKIKGIDVGSNVSPQPLSDEETRQGAINRAIASLQAEDSAYGAGLEGGVMLLENRLYLCNWGALAISPEKVYCAAGARIELPKQFLTDLSEGQELGDMMEVYAKKKNVRSHEGAIGIFTNNLVDRSEMFTHVMKLLRGQMEYWSS